MLSVYISDPLLKYLGIMMSINRIGIIGAGQMGTGIAHVMALANYEVILNDVLPEHLISAKNKIAQNLDRERFQSTRFSTHLPDNFWTTG